MEYATTVYTDNHVRHPGYQHNTPGIKEFFSLENLRAISHTITQLLQGVDEQNRPIIVPDETIKSVMSNVQRTFVPQSAGNLYDKFIIDNDPICHVTDMGDQVVEIIVSDVKANLGLDKNNRKLNIWDTVLGDFNDKGLRAHPPIKLRNKRPQPMQFNMIY
jgi:hypothetical protein